MKHEERDFTDLDTPEVLLPHVECTTPDCPERGVNMVLVEGVYKLWCPLYTPAPPKLAKPEEQ